MRKLSLKFLTKLLAIPALCLSISSQAQLAVTVPANLSAGAPLSAPDGNLKGEYWQRPIKSIFTDGRDNPEHRIDVQIRSFGPPTGTFKATEFVFLGDDLSTVPTPYIGAANAATFQGTPGNMDDGAIRFTGFINIAAPGVINMGVTSDDGSRITIGGLDIAERDNGHGDETQDVDVTFVEAGLYPIEITYFNGDWVSDDGLTHGGANFHLRMGGADITPAGVAMFHPELPFRSATVWEVGMDDDAWPLDLLGGGANAAFVQETGTNPLPGAPDNPVAAQQGDDDYYFAGVYTTVIPGNGDYVPLGVVAVNEAGAERAFAGTDNDLRYHFNLPDSLNAGDQLSVTFDALNLHIDAAANPDPRYGVEVYFNGVKVQDEIVIRPADLGTDYTTPLFSLASVNAKTGAGFDNIVTLKGINHNAEGGGNWMGIDYVKLDSASGVPPLSVGLNFGADDNGAALGLAATDTAGVTRQANWNNLNGAAGSAASGIMADQAGTAIPTGISVEWTSANTWSSTGRSEENNAFPAGPDKTMMTGYLDSNDADGVVNITVSGISSDFTAGGYSVIVYALGGTSASRYGAYTIGGETKVLNSAALPTGFVADAGVDANDTGNYVIFKNQYGSSFNLIASAVTAVGNGFRAPVNGIQIVKNADADANLVKGFLQKIRFDGSFDSAGAETVKVADLLANPRYINDQFDSSCLRTDFSVNDADECDDCGLVVRGLFIPKASGPHTFYLSADDGASLFLSTDESPANKVEIASEPLWAGRRNYLPEGANTSGGDGRGDPPINISAPIDLVAGNKYYVEGVLQERGGGDNLDVAVKGPGDPDVQDNDRAVFGDRIAVRVDLTGTSLAITENPASQQIAEGNEVTFTVAAAANSLLPDCGGIRYQWQRNEVNIPGATAASYRIAPVIVDDHLASYRCIVSIPGLSRTSSAATLEVLGTQCLAVVGATGSGDQAHVTVAFSTFIDTLADSTVDVFNYLVTGADGSAPNVLGVVVNGDGKSVTLETDPLAENSMYTVSVANVKSLVGSDTCPAPDNSATFRSWVTSPCGGVELAIWNNIGGVSLSGLTNLATYPNAPDEVRRLTTFDTGADFGDNYGARVRGLFIPPVSGAWYLYVTADDASKLFFNANGPSASGAVLVNEEAGCCTALTGRRAGPFTLEAGKGYYMEGIYKEGGGGDYIRVAARLVADTTTVLAPMPASWTGYPAAPAGIGGAFGIAQQPASMTALQSSTATFTVGFSNPNDLPVCAQWYRDGVAIEGATGPSYSIFTSLADDGAKFSVTGSIIGSPAIASEEATLTVINDVTPPVCLSASGAFNLSNIVVNFDELLSTTTANDVFNYTVPGFEVVSAALRPDGKSVLLQVNPALTPDTAYTVTIENMADLANNPQPAGGCTLSFNSFTVSCGFALQELYFNIPGVAVADVTGNAAYPNSPSLVRYKGTLQANTADEFDNYGTRMSGWLTAPVSGAYNFFMSSDDGGQFLLSTDESPANLVSVASEPTWNGRREWLTTARRNVDAPENRSTTLFPDGIQLVAGQKYYFEALMKEGGGGDNLAVAWQLPGAPLPTTAPGSEISGAFIASLANPAGASVTITQQPADQSGEENQVVNFTVAVTALTGGQPASSVFYQWSRMVPGGAWAPIVGANSATYSVPAKLTDNGNKYRVAVYVPGATATSDEATLNVFIMNTPPQFACGPNQGVNEDAGAQSVVGWATDILPHSVVRTPILYGGDFSALPEGSVLGGTAAVADGVLHLTDAVNSLQNSFATPALPLVESLTATFKIRMGGGTCCGDALPDGIGVARPADGMSITIGDVSLPVSFPVAAEEGAAVVNGFAVNIDTWDNNGADEAPALDVKVGGSVLAFQALDGVREGGRAPSGPFITDPATGLPMTFNTGNDFADMRINLDPDGTLDVDFKGVRVIDNLATGLTMPLVNARLAFGARTGGANNNHWIDDLNITAFAPDASSAELSQTVSFTATTDNASLFSEQPAVSADGTLTYTPAANASGVANVTVVAMDDGGTAGGGSDTSPPCTFTITVDPVNDCPTIGGNIALTTECQTGVSTTLSASDVEGDALTYIISAPANGTVSGTGPGVTYTPAAGFSGTDSFSYAVTDGQCTSASGVVTISVGNCSQPPTAVIGTDALVDFSPDFENPVLISCNWWNACLVLDGWTSSSPGGGDLTYLWFSESDPVPFGAGPMVTNCYEVGTHTIILTVTDSTGLTGTDSKTIEVVTAPLAIELLIEKINESLVERKTKRELVASLRTAQGHAGKENIRATQQALDVFEKKVRAQVAPNYPEEARVWILWTQATSQGMEKCIKKLPKHVKHHYEKKKETRGDK